jgi:tetratricopeptide (TPR) repeat protein
MTLHATAATPGPITGAAPDSAPEAVRNLLRALGPLPRDLLRLGAVLAPAPVPPEVARTALGSPRAAEFDAAVEELVTHGFATRDDDDLRLQALAVEVAQSEFGELLGRAPEAVLDSGLLPHARVVADHAPAHRVRLLRPVAAAFEAHGDPATAGEIHAAILATGEATSADLTAAARVEIACGLPAEAVEHARAALALAVGEPARDAAALVAAQALDSQGDYAEADRLYWQAGRLPAGSRAAAARARRLRGRPGDAVTLLEGAEPEDESDLERARSLLLDGDPRRARDVAAEVVARHHRAGRERHPRCTEAELVHADAVLALAPADPAELARQHGSEHPLTLAASVLAGRAQLARRPEAALRALGTTEQVVLRVLGDDNPLHLRIRHGMGLAHARLREFDRQAGLLEGVVGPQIRLLGRSHPETVESRLDLGLALALSGLGPRARATTLVDDAARDAAGALAAKARAARELVRIPQPFMTALFTFERIVWPPG